jgi:hypothetical protein
MAFEEQAARIEFDCGEERANAEQHAFALTRQTAALAPHTPQVNRGAQPPKQPRHGKERVHVTDPWTQPYRVVHPRIVAAKLPTGGTEIAP